MKHQSKNDWTLPGGRVVAGEDLVQRVVTEVAEETGVQNTGPPHVGRYAGSAAPDEIDKAVGSSEPSPDHK